LPARKAQAQPAARASAPATRKAGGASFGELDLMGEQPDLPTLKNGADLPVAKTLADLPARRGSADLPAPRGAVDLPTPRGVADLPAPRGTADLPARKGTADLPQPKGVTDLPVPRDAADLMVPADGKDLPTPKFGAAGFGDLDLPPATKEQVFGDLELPTPKGGPGGGDESSFADLGLDLPDLPLATTEPPERLRGGFGDIELLLEDVVESPDPAAVRRHHVIFDAPIHVEEDVALATALAGLLEARADVADPIADPGSRLGRETGHEQGSALERRGFFQRLELDDAELHVDVETVQPARGHRHVELADPVAVAHWGPEGLLDGLALEGQQRLG